jgi:hypothetical protein
VAGDTFGITSANRLVSFNRSSPSTGTAIAVTGLSAGEMLLGLDLRVGGTPAGQLIALSSMGKVYTIDPGSGAATLKSTLRPDAADNDGSPAFTSLIGTRVSMDFNNVVDQLRVVSNTGQNLRVKVDTGDTSTDANLTFGGIGSVGVTEVTYTNNFSSTCRNTVYYLDTTGDRLMTSVNAVGGVLTSVGSLSLDAGAQSGFDISTGPDGSNTAYAALTVNNSTSFYTVNLMTGAATVVGPIGQLNSGESILGLATPAPTSTPTQPVGELVALTESNKLVSFNSAFPPKLCTSQPVTGLQGGENVLGIDLRPNDGNIYGLTNTRLYTLSAVTGTATLIGPLKPNSPAGGPVDPFTGLNGTNFAADVSPPADALRVLSNTGQNLAVLFDGSVITASPLNSSTGVNGFSVTGASYTNSFSGATTSTLYDLDTQGDRLLTQGVSPGNPNNPNNGSLTAVGNLNVGDVQPMVGFEINGLNNTALAAMTVGSATSASLYNINLMTGSATLINSIGANERIRGLTYSARRQATVLGITTDRRVVAFNPTTPGSFTINNAITGMPGSEQIVGFDLRPSNGLLYVLTNTSAGQGSVYTLNPANGQATLVSRLMQNQSAGFSSLVGMSFLTDFSPPADALRVMTDAEQNIAVVVDTGGVLVSTSITRADNTAVDIVAGAYTNNFSPPNGTVLYSIDMANTQLVLTNPAGGGVAKAVGALFPGQTATTISNIASFDIAGGQDGIAVAALVPSTTTAPTFYRVSLLTGALTMVGTIGPSGTSPLVGLTVQIQ